MGLNINLSQKLNLSQRLVLSAKILQMSSVELNDYLKEISENNPVVEYSEPEYNDSRFDMLRKKLEWLDSSDEQNRYYYTSYKEDEENNDNWNFRVDDGDTIEEYLLSQINTQKLSPDVLTAARFAAKSVNNKGYLSETPASISALCNVSKISAEKAVELIKTLDPPGIGASDLKECLSIQLKLQHPCDTVALDIVENCLELVANNQLKTIAKQLNTTLDSVLDAVKNIKSLNPYPGAGFRTNDSPNYIVPDAYIYKNPEGEYEIQLNDSYSPIIKINSYYKKIVNEDGDSQAKEYVNTKFSQAEWILQCIERRRSTFLSVLSLIINKQKNFFDNGAGNLSPMKLSDISTQLEIHESTVSRAVRDKYIQCRHGIFPLSYFFTSAVETVSKNSSSSETVSQDKVKHRIKEIIDSEDKHKPYSDRVISEMLENEGISVSRRTVAKYREAMGIYGTSMRKDFFKSC